MPEDWDAFQQSKLLGSAIARKYHNFMEKVMNHKVKDASDYVKYMGTHFRTPGMATAIIQFIMMVTQEPFIIKENRTDEYEDEKGHHHTVWQVDYFYSDLLDNWFVQWWVAEATAEFGQVIQSLDNIAKDSAIAEGEKEKTEKDWFRPEDVI